MQGTGPVGKRVRPAQRAPHPNPRSGQSLLDGKATTGYGILRVGGDVAAVGLAVIKARLRQRSTQRV